jgi:hypothetical protein
MNMVRHSHVANNLKVVTAADTLQRILKKDLSPSPFRGSLGADSN